MKKEIIKVKKVLVFTKTQKHFIDFILITSVLFGLLALIGSILTVCGIIPTYYDSFPFYSYIVDIVILSFCELYLLIYKCYRLYKRF